ncbi:hypothetical protein [Tritonibacter mobilis]|uniref:hypothetical protein n=1 Tax=Tritonibacter mobilis TaxID=379347 RepID=UPI00089A20F3|nr:hypothetical protein [Tritonibacter mobilis]GLP88291.1 hypothetical protein GCM10007921_38530 [Tritonibacter mobilis]SDY07952.1 hypothetical protein SAMN05444385_12516 [Tritonibacter mobilis]
MRDFELNKDSKFDTNNSSNNKNSLRKRIQHIADHPYWSTIITIIGTLLTWIAIFASTENAEGDSQREAMRLLISTAGSIAVLLGLNWMWFRGLVDGQKDEIEKLSASFEQQRELFFKDYQRQSKKLELLANRSKTFQVYPDKIKASEALLERLSESTNVKNLFLDIPDPISSDSSKDSRVIASYEKWLNNNKRGLWQDVVGIKEYFSDRYKAISPNSRHKGEHRVFVLKHTMPTINFIILDYASSRPTEVFWGWVSGDESEQSPIYATIDRDVLKTFEDYFEALIKRTWNRSVFDESDKGFLIDYTDNAETRLQNASSRLVDKVGLWITVSYRKDDQSDNQIANRLGLVEIGYNERGISVQAKIYNQNGLIEETETEHREIAHYLDSVFIGYRLRDSDFSGICQYKFKRYQSEELMTGVYVDRRESIRNTLIGSRYNAHSAISGINLTAEEVRVLLEEQDAAYRKLENFQTLVTGPTVVSS